MSAYIRAAEAENQSFPFCSDEAITLVVEEDVGRSSSAIAARDITLHDGAFFARSPSSR